MAKTVRAVPGTMQAPTTNFAQFDLLEYIASIEDDYMAARISNSLAWRWDVLILSNVRAVYKEITEQLMDTGSIETRADAATLLAERAEAEANFDAYGSGAAGALTQFHQLMDLRPDVVRLAVVLGDNGLNFRGRSMQYEDPGLDARIREQREAKVNDQTVANFELEAAAFAKRNHDLGRPMRPDFVQTYVENKKKAALKKAEQLADYVKNQAPALEVVLTLMQEHRPNDMPTCESFASMDVDLQRRIVEITMQIAERAKDDSVDDRDHQGSFAMILNSFLEVQDLLARVLRAPKFNNGLSEIAGKVEPRLDRATRLKTYDTSATRRVAAALAQPEQVEASGLDAVPNDI